MKTKYKRYVSRIEVKRDKDSSSKSSSKSSHQRASSPKSSSPDSFASSSPSNSPLPPLPSTPPKLRTSTSSSSSSCDRVKSITQTSTIAPDPPKPPSTGRVDKVINKTPDEPKEKPIHDNVAEKQTIKNTRSSSKGLTQSKEPTVIKIDTVKSKEPIEVVEEASNASKDRPQSDKFKPKVPTNTSKSAIIEVPAVVKTKSPASVPNKRQRGAAFDAALRQADDVTDTDEKPTPKRSTDSLAKVVIRPPTDTIVSDGRKVIVPSGILGTKVFRSYLKLRRFNPITLQPAETELRRLMGTKRQTIPRAAAKDAKKAALKAVEKVKVDEVKLEQVTPVKKDDTKVPIQFETKSNVKPKRKTTAKVAALVVDDESPVKLKSIDVIDLTAPTSKTEPKSEAITPPKNAIKRANTTLAVSLKRELSIKSPRRSTTPRSILNSKQRRDASANAKKHVSFTGISSSDSDEDKPLKALTMTEHDAKHTAHDDDKDEEIAVDEARSQKSICDKNIETVPGYDSQPNSAVLIETVIETVTETINDDTKTVRLPALNKREKKQRKSKQKRSEQIDDDSEHETVQYSIAHNEIEAIPSTPMPIQSDNNNTGKRKRTKSKALINAEAEQSNKKVKRPKIIVQQMVVDELTATDEPSMVQMDVVDTIKEVNVEGILKSPIESPPVAYINAKPCRSYSSNVDPLALNASDDQLQIIALPPIEAVKDVEEKRVSPLKIRIKRSPPTKSAGKAMKVKRCDKQTYNYNMSNVTDVIEAVATGACGTPSKRHRKKKELPADFVAYDNDDDDLPQIQPTDGQWKPKPRSKRSSSHEHDSHTIESEIMLKQQHFENDMRSRYGGNLFDAVVQMNPINETTESTEQLPTDAMTTIMTTTPATTVATAIDDNLLGFIGSTEQLQQQIIDTTPDSMCDLAAIDGNEMPPPNILLNTHAVNAADLIQIADKCIEPCAIEAPTSVVTTPSVNMVNVGTGTESPTATVDSTTSGYSQGTLTVYALGFPFNTNMNGMTEMTGYANQLNPIYEEGQYYLQTDSIANCVEPLEQINQEDIISVLGRTHDTSDLNMDTAINIATFETPNTEPARTVYLVDCNSLNFAPSLPNIGILRTKANVKQIYQPLQLTTTTTATTVSPQQLNLINDNYCNGMVNVSHELSTKLLRHDNPLLNGSSSFDETVLEIQQAANMSGDTMVTSTETTSSTPRRNGLNILFTTPTKHTSGEDIQFEDLFINESQQQLLNAENFPTTTTSDEPQFNLYGDAFT